MTVGQDASAGAEAAAGAAGGNAAGTGAQSGASAAPEDDAALGEKGERALEAWKARAKAAEAKAKEYEPLAARARELEEQGKSEAQKAAEKAAAAERAAAEATLKAAQYEAAAAAGLPLSMATRLRGSSAEELAEDAKALLAELGGNGQRRTTNGNAGDQGAAPGGTMSDALRAMFRNGRGSITT